MSNRSNFPRWTLAAAIALLVGCQPLGLLVGQPTDQKPVASQDGGPVTGQDTLVSNNSASLTGLVTGPASLISNNSANLVSNNSANYRTQALATVPVKRALVYLASPNEQLYAGSDGKALYALTDDNGNYSFKVAPAEVPIIVTVLQPQNRRLVGFLIPKKGGNVLDVDLATTVVTEFLRDQARLAHKTLADYPTLAADLPEIIRLTREMIARDELHLKQSDSDPSSYIDLAVNSIPAMNHEYVRAFAASNQELSDAWKHLLGYRPLLIDELDVGYPNSDYHVLDVTANSDAIFTAAYSHASYQIDQTTGSGSKTLVDVPRTDIRYIGGMLASGSHVFAACDDFLIDIDPAPDGVTSLWDDNGLTPRLHQYNDAYFDQPDVSGNAVINDVEFHGGWAYFASADTHEIWRCHLDETGAILPDTVELVAGVPQASQDPASFFTGDDTRPGQQVRFNLPCNITFHQEGAKEYLYVADTLNHRIRRVDLASPGFPTETFMGLGSTAYGNLLKPVGPVEDGKASTSQEQGYTDIDDPAGVPRAKAGLISPHKVLFDAAGRMFIADTDHLRVRMYDPATDRVYTIAGAGAGVPSVTGDSRRSGLGEVYSIAFDAQQQTLLIADSRNYKLRRVHLPFGL
ncbi:MAG TPA: hypothetical protein V6D05_00840 [Stenomitos sp.]